MDDASQEDELEIMLAKQHHDMLVKKKKADKKMKDDVAFNEWTLLATLYSMQYPRNRSNVYVSEYIFY